MDALNELDRVFGKIDVATDRVRDFRALRRVNVFDMIAEEFDAYMAGLSYLVISGSFCGDVVSDFSNITFNDCSHMIRAAIQSYIITLGSLCHDTVYTVELIESMSWFCHAASDGRKSDMDDRYDKEKDIKSQTEEYLKDIVQIAENRWVYNDITSDDRVTDVEYFFSSLVLRRFNLVNSEEVGEYVQFFKFMFNYYETEVLTSMRDDLAEHVLLEDFGRQISILNSGGILNSVSLDWSVDFYSKRFRNKYCNGFRIAKAAEWYQYILTMLFRKVSREIELYFFKEVM